MGRESSRVGAPWGWAERERLPALLLLQLQSALPPPPARRCLETPAELWLPLARLAQGRALPWRGPHPRRARRPARRQRLAPRGSG
jgi:hypothetical protein